MKIFLIFTNIVLNPFFYRGIIIFIILLLFIISIIIFIKNKPKLLFSTHIWKKAKNIFRISFFSIINKLGLRVLIFILVRSNLTIPRHMGFIADYNNIIVINIEPTKPNSTYVFCLLSRTLVIIMSLLFIIQKNQFSVLFFFEIFHHLVVYDIQRTIKNVSNFLFYPL